MIILHVKLLLLLMEAAWSLAPMMPPCVAYNDSGLVILFCVEDQIEEQAGIFLSLHYLIQKPQSK